MTRRRSPVAEFGRVFVPALPVSVAWPLRSFGLVNEQESIQESPADRIERAAIELFGERGIESVSVRELARCAGVTIGSISYYFGSKEALYRHCVDRLVNEFVEDVSSEELTGTWFPGEQSDERSVRLRRLVRIWVDLQMTREESLRAFGNESVIRPVWKALRFAQNMGGEKRVAPLFGYMGSMLLGSILTDDQIEHLSGVSATQARGRWRTMMMGFLAGDVEEKAVAQALEAAAVGKA